MLIWLISFLLFASTCFAQVSNPPLGIRDEGGTINRPVFIIDCVGSGISCAFSGITGTLTVSGGGTLTQYDFDTSAEFFGILGDETGSGVVMGNNAPTMTSPTVNTALNISEGIISDSTIVEADLKIVDTASDEDILTRETTIGDFEWHTGAELCVAITGSADLCDADDAGTGAGLTAANIDTSQEIAAIVKDETGSASLGMLVFNNSPIMTSPTVNTSLTTDYLTANRFVLSGSGKQLQTAGGTSSILSSSVADTTGTGVLVFNTSPTMTTPTVQTSFIFENSDGTDVMTGNTGGVSMNGIFALASGTAPVVTGPGQINVDTTRGQLLIMSGNTVGVLPHLQTRCGFYENLVAADDNISLGMFNDPVTITGVSCSFVGTGTTKATITLEDGGGNAMTITGTNPSCVAHGTDAPFASVTAGNELNRGEIVRFDTTNTPDPTTDDYTICLEYRYIRQ